MKLTMTTMEALATGFNTSLQEGFARGKAAATKFLIYCMVMPSNTAMETYAWLAMMGSMRKWIGPRLANKMEKKAMILVNEDYENTVAVDRNNIEDDKLGLYPTAFQQMGYDAELLWPRLAIAALVANGNWLDGAPFFGTTRKYGKSVISNKTTDALSAESFDAAMATMMGYCGYDGNGLGVVPDTLIVGPANRKMGENICENSKAIVNVTIGDGSKTAPAVIDNTNQGKVKLVIDERLVGAAANHWYLAQCNGPIKPVFVQKRKEGALVRWDTDQSECVKKDNENHYGLHYRGAAGLSLPHLIYAGIL